MRVHDVQFEPYIKHWICNCTETNFQLRNRSLAYFAFWSFNRPAALGIDRYRWRFCLLPLSPNLEDIRTSNELHCWCFELAFGLTWSQSCEDCTFLEKNSKGKWQILFGPWPVNFSIPSFGHSFPINKSSIAKFCYEHESVVSTVSFLKYRGLKLFGKWNPKRFPNNFNPLFL